MSNSIGCEKGLLRLVSGFSFLGILFLQVSAGHVFAQTSDGLTVLPEVTPFPVVTARPPVAAATPLTHLKRKKGAPDLKTEDPIAKLPKSGVIASTLPAGGFGKKGYSTWTDTDIEGKKTAPISASVSRVDSKNWNLKVTNNSEEDTFSVSIKVDQVGKSGSSVKSDSFSYSLKPKESVDRPVVGAQNASGAQVVLENFKRLNSKAPSHKGGATSAVPKK